MKQRWKDSATILVISALMGVSGGLIGAAFSVAVNAVTAVRHHAGWLICLLPLAGVLSVLVTRGCRASNFGTADALACANESTKTVPTLLSVSVFIGTVLSHLCGASVGKEGAALQIGGGMAAVANKFVAFDEQRKRTVLLCAMAALFSAAFGTPLTAAVFVVEAARLKRERWWELLPCGLAAYMAFFMVREVGIEVERLPLQYETSVSLTMTVALLVAAVAASLLGELFCITLRFSKKQTKRWLKNEYVRIAVGGLLTVAITALIGHGAYNGSSIDELFAVFVNEQVAYEAFALKFLLTVIAVSVGFRGGQIVPSLFIGAAIGGAVGMLFGISIPLSAAVGLVAFFCAVTNCTAASVLIAWELFGGQAVGLLVIAALLSRLISGKVTLYGDKPLPKRP